LDTTSLEKVLNDLAKLDVQDRPILGDRRNIASAVRRAKDDAKKHSDEGLKKPKVPEPVKKPPPLAAAALLGWTLDNRAPPKAEQLRKLTLDLSGATGNVEIAEIVTRFVSVLLHANGSRKLTKEGIAFLETLCKQLGEHGKAVPRWTRSSSDKEQLSDQSGATEEVENKLRVVARLRRDVGLPTCGRQQLAKLVAEFGAMTTRSNGRTVTKDGFGFLEGLAGRLKALA
jgi:casein kinase 1